MLPRDSRSDPRHYPPGMLNRAAAALVGDVHEWLSSRPDDGDRWLAGADAPRCLEFLIEARENWLRCPDPTLWRSGDAHRLLVDTAAPRLVDRYGLREHGPAVLRALVDFLDETDRFHPASMRTVVLRRELDRAAGKFPAAMADESGWRLAKRVFTAMRVDGIDINDDTAVDAWVEEFNAAPTERRRVVFGAQLDRQPELLTSRIVVNDDQVAAIAPGRQVPEALRRHDPGTCPDCLAPPVNPAISLPPIEELASAARESAMLRDLVACGRWAGSGRKVTKRGYPMPADTRSLAAALGVEIRDSARDPGDHIGLSRTWQLALDGEVLRLHRTEVVAGPGYEALERALTGAGDPERVLALWQEITDIAVPGPSLPVGSDAQLSKLAEFARPWGPRALGEMYRLGGGVELDELVEQLVVDYHGTAATEMLSMMVGTSVRSGLLAGAGAGAVAVTEPAEDDADPMIRASMALTGEPGWALAPVPGTRVRLTPLGRYLVRCNLLAEGTPAPLLESSSSGS